MLHIRPYRAQDRPGVRHVFTETAYLGRSIRPYYSDDASLADALTGYYTDQEPGSAWVVVDGERVLGYLLGCLDTRRAPAPERVLAKHALTRFLWLRPGTAAYYWRGLLDVIRHGGSPLPRLDYTRWPAHVHVDLLPEARGHGLGPKLFQLWLDHAGKHGACGMWSMSYLENQGATAFHKAVGLRPHGEPIRIYDAAGLPTRAQVWVREIEPA